MQFGLSEEESVFRSQVTALAAKAFGSGYLDRAASAQFPWADYRTLGKHGLLGLMASERYGGQAASFVATGLMARPAISTDWIVDLSKRNHPFIPTRLAGTHPQGVHMAEAVIVEAVRTPVGKRNGGLSGIHPVDLSAAVLTALAERSGIDPSLVDDVIWGCVGQVDEQAVDIARNAVLTAGWPLSVAGVSIDRQCGSSQQSISFAVASVIAGHADAVVAGGVESMSRVPMGSTTLGSAIPFTARGWVQRFGEVAPNQGIGAEMIAAQWGFSRQDLDSFASVSHAKAAAAQDEGAFKNEITAVETDRGLIDADEGIRRGTSPEGLAKLKPAFAPDGVIHAGNASQISDGAAALLVMTPELAKTHGLTPIARIHTSVVVGSDPVIMLTGPIPATQKVLNRSGLSVGDIGVFEVNEAFAPVPMAWLQEIRADESRLNPLGGAIALGHPLGGSGARIATTMLHHMRNKGIRYGLQTMCEGGGQANATIFELL